MPLYRWNTDNLELVPATTFEAERLQERADLQQMLRDQPDVLEEGLFIVADEYSNWQDSSRSIDLLGLDESGRLVVIELKRTQSGDHSELQAIRYAAMVSNLTLNDVIDAHRRYLEKRGCEDDAKIRILTHLGVAEETDTMIQTEYPRIILASAGFSRELTTSVLWLNDVGLNITCIKLQLFKNGVELFLETSQVIPLQEASDYLVRVRDRRDIEYLQRQGAQALKKAGGGAFFDAIERVRENHKPMLRQFYEWASLLETEGLATLETRQSSLRTTLRLSLPNEDVRLAIIWQRGAEGYYHLRVNEIRNRAPKANAR